MIVPTEQRKTKTIRIRTTPAPRVYGDELFPAEGPSLGGLITCRVCEGTEIVCIGHPALLCSTCLRDVSATASHVAGVYSAALAFFMAAAEALAEAVQTSPERVWWGRVEAARGAVEFDRALFAQAWERAKSAGGEKLRLCLLWENLDREAVALEPLNAWYVAAEKELCAARAALGEPIDV